VPGNALVKSTWLVARTCKRQEANLSGFVSSARGRWRGIFRFVSNPRFDAHCGLKPDIARGS
jgi:hypothetical protein